MPIKKKVVKKKVTKKPLKKKVTKKTAKKPVKPAKKVVKRRAQPKPRRAQPKPPRTALVEATALADKLLADMYVKDASAPPDQIPGVKSPSPFPAATPAPIEELIEPADLDAEGNAHVHAEVDEDDGLGIDDQDVRDGNEEDEGLN